MPFLEDFVEWSDDGTTNVWERVNDTGAFRGLRCSVYYGTGATATERDKGWDSRLFVVDGRVHCYD